jgi:hypothetical protein
MTSVADELSWRGAEVILVEDGRLIIRVGSAQGLGGCPRWLLRRLHWWVVKRT